MTQTASNIGVDIRPVTRTSRVRPWIALAAGAVVFVLGLLGVAPFVLVLPVIGVGLALGSSPDHVVHPRPPGGCAMPCWESPWSPRWRS